VLITGFPELDEFGKRESKEIVRPTKLHILSKSLQEKGCKKFCPQPPYFILDVLFIFLWSQYTTVTEHIQT
jgi:hypothetical protein